MFSSQASRKTKKKEGGALRAQRASSNVFSNFEQTQIQEFKEVRPCSCTGNPSTQKLMPEGSPGKCNAGDKALDPEPGKGAPALIRGSPVNLASVPGVHINGPEPRWLH